MSVETIGAKFNELDSDRQAKPGDGPAVIVESGRLSSRKVNCSVFPVLAPAWGGGRQINVLSDQLMRIDALHPAWVEEVWIAG